MCGHRAGWRNGTGNRTQIRRIAPCSDRGAAGCTVCACSVILHEDGRRNDFTSNATSVGNSGASGRATLESFAGVAGWIICGTLSVNRSCFRAQKPLSCCTEDGWVDASSNGFGCVWVCFSVGISSFQLETDVRGHTLHGHSD